MLNSRLLTVKEQFFQMLNQKYFHFQEYETSTEKDENQYLYKKDDELKGDNFTDENEGVVKIVMIFKF